jgi:hypothetical protein
VYADPHALQYGRSPSRLLLSLLKSAWSFSLPHLVHTFIAN